MGASADSGSLAKAQDIMRRDADDLGDHELAEATAHALVAATEHLAHIAALMTMRWNGEQVNEFVDRLAPAMTEQHNWHTAEPPWLNRLHPDLVEEPDGQERTAEQRADDLLEQLERAAAGRVPPALAGSGWAEADVAEYDPEPAAPVIRERTPGPWRCQLPEPQVCEECGRQFATTLAMAVHVVDHRDTEHQDDHATTRTKVGTAGKPKPGAHRKKKRKR